MNREVFVSCDCPGCYELAVDDDVDGMNLCAECLIEYFEKGKLTPKTKYDEDGDPIDDDEDGKPYTDSEPTRTIRPEASRAKGDTEMAVENDPAFEKWSRAVDNFVAANDHLKSIPENNPGRQAAWDAVRQAALALAEAGKEIDPKFRG